MAVTKETTYKDFYSFANGVKTDSALLNSWVREGLQEVRSGASHYSASTGDATVVVLDHSTSIDVIVSTSSGVSRVTLFGEDEQPSEFCRDWLQRGGKEV